MIVSVEYSDGDRSWTKSIRKISKKFNPLRSGCLSSLLSLAKRPSSTSRDQSISRAGSWASGVSDGCGFSDLDKLEISQRGKQCRQPSWESNATPTLCDSTPSRRASQSPLWSFIDLNRDYNALQALQKHTIESLPDRRRIRTASVQNLALDRAMEYGHLYDCSVLRADREQTATYIGNKEQQKTQYEFASAPWSFGTMDDPEAAATLLESLRYQVNKRRFEQGQVMPPLLDIRDTLNYVIDRGSHTLTARQWDTKRCRSVLDYATESLQQLDLDNSKFVEPGYDALRQQAIQHISKLESSLYELECRDRRMARAVEVAETCTRSLKGKSELTASAESVRSLLATALSRR